MLRVVSYNVHGLRGDRQALVEVVRELAPDVLVIQEAPRRLRWRTRNAQLAHDVDLVYVTGGAGSLGNVILTNLSVRPNRTWDLRYPLTPGQHMRGAAFARCTAAGSAFVVVGSHLATDPAERPGQARLLKKALTDLDRHSASAPPDSTPDPMTIAAPVIFAGDLNDAPDGVVWRIVADGLVDAAATHPASGSSVSGPSASTAGPDTTATYPDTTTTYPATGQRLDVILVDPRITVSGYRVADSPAARRASDHLPVVADLALPT